MTHQEPQVIKVGNGLHHTENTIQVHTLLEGAFKKISALTLRVGHELKKHDATSDTLLMVMQGSVRLQFDTKTLDLSTGDSIVLQTGQPHALVCQEDATLILLR